MSVNYLVVIPNRNNWSEPMLNISNGYAHYPALMMVVSYSRGRVPNHQLPKVLENLKKLNASDLVTPTEVEGNTTFCGRSKEDIERYRDRLIEMVELAIAGGGHIEWC